jgi:hypothetical protein
MTDPRVTEPLPTFKPDATCPKCNHDEIDTHYVVDHEVACQTTYAPLSALSPGARACCHYYDGEHLHRICRRCTYRWAEAVVSPGMTYYDESPREFARASHEGETQA